LDLDDFRAWLGAYVRACRSNDPEDVAKLFSENAEYYPGPFEEPHRGRASIIKHWADDPWTVGPRFEAWVEPLVLQKVAGGALGVAEWRASYPEAPPEAAGEYSSIFVLRFDEQARCTEYREWCVGRR
jgi:hypothetical protein